MSRSVNPPLLLFTLLLCAVGGRCQSLPKGIPTFIDRHCADCHDREAKKGELDLLSLAQLPITADTLPTWIKAHDRVRDGEMPPDKKTVHSDWQDPKF